MTTIFCVGVAVLDHVFAVDALPTKAEKYRALSLSQVGGGCAATAAVAVARLGGHAVLATRVGDDAVADAISAELESYGVDCRFVRRIAGCQSSQSAVFVDRDGERMIINYRDSELPQDASWLPAISTIGAAAVLADTRWPNGAAHSLAAARSSGLFGVIDAEQPVREAEEAIRQASHIAFSRQGLEDWTSSDDLAHGVRAVAAETGVFVSATDGANGVFCAGDRDVPDKIAAPRVAAVDTLGAGDVWHGAFALRLGEGGTTGDAIRFANASAALKCTRVGGRAGVPTRDEVDAFMAREG